MKIKAAIVYMGSFGFHFSITFRLKQTGEDTMPMFEATGCLETDGCEVMSVDTYLRSATRLPAREREALMKMDKDFVSVRLIEIDVDSLQWTERSSPSKWTNRVNFSTVDEGEVYRSKIPFNRKKEYQLTLLHKRAQFVGPYIASDYSSKACLKEVSSCVTSIDAYRDMKLTRVCDPSKIIRLRLNDGHLSTCHVDYLKEFPDEAVRIGRDGFSSLKELDFTCVSDTYIQGFFEYFNITHLRVLNLSGSEERKLSLPNLTVGKVIVNAHDHELEFKKVHKTIQKACFKSRLHEYEGINVINFSDVFFYPVAGIVDLTAVNLTHIESSELTRSKFTYNHRRDQSRLHMDDHPIHDFTTEVTISLHKEPNRQQEGSETTV